VAAEITNSGPGSFSVNTGALTINGGSGAGGYARLFGNPDVHVTVTNGAINLTAGTAGAYAAVEAFSPTSIYVDFPNLTANGFAVNGVLSGVYDAPTATGFIAGGLPATLGTNLLVTYAGTVLPPPAVSPQTVQAVQQQVNQVVQQTNQITTTTTTQSAPLNNPSDTTAADTAGASSTSNAGESNSGDKSDTQGSEKTAQTGTPAKSSSTPAKKPAACR
jgi:hypothetical protein